MNLAEKTVNLAASPQSANAWFNNNDCTLFVRVCKRQIDNKLVDCIDLANGTLLEPIHKDLPNFMTHIERELGKNYLIFVESLLDPDTIQFFRDRGYYESKQDTGFTNFRRLPGAA